MFKDILKWYRFLSRDNQLLYKFLYCGLKNLHFPIYRLKSSIGLGLWDISNKENNNIKVGDFIGSNKIAENRR